MTKRLLKAEDLYALYSVANPKLSPSNEEAVFIRTHLHEEDQKYYAQLFHIQLATGAITQWTFGKERISHAAWSPDGSQIAFLSNRDGKKQLYIIHKNGGEAQQITTFTNGVQSFVWSPCGEKVWVTGKVKTGKSFTDKEDKATNKLEPYVVQEMKYKMDGIGGDGLRSQHEHSHIAQVTVANQLVEQFTQGDYDYTIQGISNDGSQLIVSVNRTENKDYDFKSPLYIVNTVTKEETPLIETEGQYKSAVFSPDDRYIAYIGQELIFKNATHTHLYIFDRETGVITKLTESLDLPVGDYAVADVQQGVEAPSVVWTEHNDLYFQVSTNGDVRLYYATLDGAIYPASPEEEHVYSYDVAKDGSFALVAVSNPTFVGELFYYEVMTGERQQLTFFNDVFHQEVELVQPESFYYNSKDGFHVQGWILKPAHFKEGQKYPLVLEIHGGPHAMYANTFFHELQLLAANGYGVLYVNPRGSHGYSQHFVNAVRGDYGGGDYRDILIGLEEAIAAYQWVDENRLGVTGGSYGGFMTNWIIGQTNHFKAAVTQRSISNWVSFYGVSDIGYYFSDWQLDADILNVEKLWAHSPLKYVQNIETPLLILHSEKDFRCPIEQAEQLFIALKTLGKEVAFVRFPESNHNLSRTGNPNLRIARLQQIVTWFEQYLS